MQSSSDKPYPRSGTASEEVNDQIKTGVEAARERATEVTDSIKHQARDAAEQQKEAGADQISGIAQAADAAADKLQDQIPLASEYIRDLARRMETAASSLRERNIDELLQQATDFGRKQPAMLFAGALLTGVALARFAKSSSKTGSSAGKQE
jgi:uncharacterized phage infection (PIP) family protein YhgE